MLTVPDRAVGIVETINPAVADNSPLVVDQQFAGGRVGFRGTEHAVQAIPGLYQGGRCERVDLFDAGSVHGKQPAARTGSVATDEQN